MDAGLVNVISDQLYRCDLIYARKPRPEAELKVAAATFAGDVGPYCQGLSRADIEAAFSCHRARSPFYPRPADIIPFLEEAVAKKRARYPEPRPEGRLTPEVPRLVNAALSGNQEARELLTRIWQEAK